MAEIKIIYKKISDLRHAEYNPRRISHAQMENLKRSIREMGFVEPAIVNEATGRENIIIGGNQRIEAAKALGMIEIPVVLVNLDESKEKLLNIALNKIIGEFDEQKLTDLLLDLSKSNADLILSGFNDGEIEQILKGNNDNINVKIIERQEVSIRTRKNINVLEELTKEINQISTELDKALAVADRNLFFIKLHSLILFLDRVERKFVKEKEGGQEKEKGGDINVQ